MTKSESFNWHRTGRICNGLHDFGLLRDKPDAEEQKPKLFLNHISRTIFAIGIIAGLTFLVCLMLTNKYHQSAISAHHYESFIYEKDREKLFLGRNSSNIRLNDSDFSVAFKRVQNTSQNITIDEINELMPIETVLHPVNNDDANNRKDKMPNIQQLNKNLSGVRLRINATKNSRVGLAQLLKQKEAINSNESNIPNELNSLQFAQLESYKHYYNVKNLHDVLKYVSCPFGKTCSFSGTEINIAEENENQNKTDIEDEFVSSGPPQIKEDKEEREEVEEEDVHHFQVGDDKTFSVHEARDIGVNFDQNDDLEQAHSQIPAYFSPVFSSHPAHGFDQFYHFRPMSPLEINDMGVSENDAPKYFHRFSNRIYQRPNEQENETPRLFTEDGLEPYLKPPTPTPTTISFTPTYTTAIFHGFDQPGTRESEDLKDESSTWQPSSQLKPISLMVEILPANDYQPSVVANNQNQLSRQSYREDGDTDQVNNQPWLPWKLSQYSQNRITLLVHLVPQVSTPINRS